MLASNPVSFACKITYNPGREASRAIQNEWGIALEPAESVAEIVRRNHSGPPRGRQTAQDQRTRILKPLDSAEDTIALIAAVSCVPRAEVKERLISEAAEIGSNVYRGMKAQDIPLYVPSEKLDRFYVESDTFLYETTVWNACSAKQNMRTFVSSRLDQFGKSSAEVFCFGDGLGFDSTYLAQCGHRVRYFEPSLRCQEYARQVFQRNQADIKHLHAMEDLQDGSLDAVVCLDVLEHIPQPQELVKLFYRLLKPNGLLFVHAPFWCIHWTRSTHLKQNRHFSGDLKHLYEAHCFSALDSSVFWDPILFQKSNNSPAFNRATSASCRIWLGKLLLTIGRWDSAVHTWIARKIARPPKSWIASLHKAE